jgi:hypothetical protein
LAFKTREIDQTGRKCSNYPEYKRLYAKSFVANLIKNGRPDFDSYSKKSLQINSQALKQIFQLLAAKD